MKRASVLLFAVAGTLVPRAAARAENEVTIRGAYYREPSTRVIQPVVEIAKDLPYGFDVRAHYLVDTITSASAAAGTTGADSIFTEVRSEVGIGVGKNWNRTRATLSYKYSAESDYWSHAIWGSVAQRLWGDTMTLGLFGGVSLDAVAFRTRTPDCRNSPDMFTCPLDSVYGGFSYTQVLSPVDVAQVNLDAADLWGFQANPYRQVAGIGYETLPTHRLRTALSVRYGHYFPDLELGVQFQFRYYHDYDPTSLSHDPWGLSASTLEGRVYRRLTRDLEVRLLYRQYFQQTPAFWCDVPTNPGCSTATNTGPAPWMYYSSDPALGPVRTEYPEVKLIWDADALRGVPFFRWFATGTFEISYGRYFQNDAFGNAHVLQTGYTMPY